MRRRDAPLRARGAAVLAAAPRALRVAALALLAAVAAFGAAPAAVRAAAGLAPAAPPAAAAPHGSAIDRRVTAIPAATLLARPAASLLDARRQHVAARFRAYERAFFLAWVASQIAAYLALWRTGYAARLRDAIARAVPGTFAARGVYGAALTLAGALAALPASLARYRVDRAFNVSALPPLGFVHDGLVSTGLDALVVGAIVACVFWLVDRTHLWYLWTMGALFVLTLAIAFLEPIVVAPLYNRYVPLPANAPIREPLHRLARRAGIGDAPIDEANLSHRSDSIVADVAGFGPTTHIVLGDNLLSSATPGEVLFLAAREFGHYAHEDDFRLSLVWTTLFIAATALAVFAADRVPFRRDDEPLARLSLVFAFMGVFGLAFDPLYDAYSRNIESRADAYALELTRDPVSAVRAYVRIGDETLAPLCPSRAVRLLFYNSPPLGTRIAKVRRRRDPCS